MSPGPPDDEKGSWWPAAATTNPNQRTRHDTTIEEIPCLAGGWTGRAHEVVRSGTAGTGRLFRTVNSGTTPPSRS